MARIAGVDLPPNKRALISLTYVYGVGQTRAQKVFSALSIDPNKHAKDLTDDEVSRIASFIDKNFVVEGLLRREQAQNIQRLKDIRCYRGVRHIRGLPVRGQRTKTNARTRKGPRKTVAVKRGVKEM